MSREKTRLPLRGDKSWQGEEKEEETTHDYIHRLGGELEVEQRKEETERGAELGIGKGVGILGCPKKLGSIVSKWVIIPIYPIYK